ncbi:hypothetical protein [Nocardia sp. CC227C]|uniref:hypothetical protein n=1 Tax=Nocardia sp. CC227C TaxID=3044562 RepID=UPI00278BD9E8|nr:hypothetical protein [Nocardia sp. CC227C]
MDPDSDDADGGPTRLLDFIARREAEAAAALAAARIGSGKEPFSLEALRAAYDLTLDLGTRPLTAADVAEYERRYYLTTPADIRTVAQFGEYLYSLYINEVG